MGPAAQAVSGEHRQSLYTALLLSSKLDNHLAEIDTHAEALFSQLVKQIAQQEALTKQFKAENQMEWVREMNNICNRAEELIYHEYMYC